MNKQTFQNLLQEQGITLSEKQLNQYDKYYKLLVEWNEKMNLTAITEEEDVYTKHFYDSLTPAFYFPFQGNLKVCDIGAGAGFPSIPLKIAFPDIHVTIVDSLKKRITFLDTLKDELELDNVTFYHNRAEIFGQNIQFREQYDVVMARAVAKMSVLTEFCLPLVKVGGHMIAMKGSQFHEEKKGADKAVQLLGGKWDEVHTLTLPEEDSERNIAIISKVKQTPKKYPRKPGTPIKKPIS
ncbi:16S rRNA (guanine(527)-N(7))-methyltransferase RsmG [Salirhabdus salicampi]|uniref:16S rRNA (guanine(527)-N(7))-methyltransferase RsmG n=1 Tax=Salirhabdus salicampi TaxID=476102 RepID=UPI0020C26B23|nr:16S rRNA (guanine(527)-N(7))-methyltransferase RsmG [Salirhabdus salicampi]MCP8617210.1 16S rRNA (guanine(527)-N(7))-methyltransferase RsmG [Salirhabdus salicampi]